MRAAEAAKHALRRCRPASGFSTSRWRWSAFEWLLYGTECYARIIGAYPQYMRHRQLSDAATAVQRSWRGRLLLRFTRVSHQLLAVKRAREEAATIAIETRWATYIQQLYRGMKARTTHRCLRPSRLTPPKPPDSAQAA